MELLVLDTEFKSSATLDIFESLIWTDRYFECGDFEIYTPAESEIMKMLPKGYYLYLKESEHVMIVEDVEIETDVEQGAHLKITGRSLESILDRRVIWGQTVLSGNLQDGIKKLLNENAISPSDGNRKIPNLSFQDSSDVRIKALTLEAQYYGDNLYDAIVDICKNVGVGFKIVLNGTNLVFSLYMGTDRSYSQVGNPYVVFSPGFDNLMNSNYIESTRTLKNVTLVAGEGEGSDRKTTTVYLGASAASGMDRRELFTDASGISQTVEDGTLTDAEYISQLSQKGNEELSNNTETISFEGEVDISATYTYDKDYFLGDVVQVGNEFGNEARCRITEFVRSQDETGNEYYPTFETLDDFTESNPFAIRLTKVAGSSIKVNDHSYTKTNTEPVIFIPWNLGGSNYTGWMVMGRTYEAIQGTVNTPQYCHDVQEIVNGRNVYIKHIGSGMYYTKNVDISTENFNTSVNPIGIYSISRNETDNTLDPDNYWLQFAENLLYAVDGGGQQLTLPEGYQRLNYLQSSGTQYINAGFNPNSNTRAIFSILFGSIPFEDVGCFGSRNSYRVGQFSLVFRRTGELRFEYENQSPIAGTLSVNNYHFIDINKNVINLDGNLTAATFSNFQVSYPAILFGLFEKSIYTSNVMTRMTSCKLYDNGTLIRDFIPCINPSGEYGLYDVVNNQFYGNAGTGSFTGG